MDTLMLPWRQGAMDYDDASVAAVFCLQLPSTSKRYVNRSLQQPQIGWSSPSYTESWVTWMLPRGH